jgi:hypothetical protein
LVAQELLEFDDQNLAHTYFNEEEKCWIGTKDIDIWKDAICMKLLNENILLNTTDAEESKKNKRGIINYHWHDQKFTPRGCLCLNQRKERPDNPNA